jgi:hypothetical protein
MMIARLTLLEWIMQRLKYLLTVVGGIQLALGTLYLIVPHQMLAWMGHSAIANDIAYPLGMLSARFLVYGALMVLAAREPERNRPLILGMVAIQLIDLAVGVYYTFSGAVTLSLSAFPMFNAFWIALLLWWWRPAIRRAD